MIITLTTIEDIPPEADIENCYLKCFSSGGQVILIWGSVEDGYRNMDSVRYQKVPVIIETDIQEGSEISFENENRAYWVSRLEATLSIEEHNQIIVLVEF